MLWKGRGKAGTESVEEEKKPKDAMGGETQMKSSITVSGRRRKDVAGTEEIGVKNMNWLNIESRSLDRGEMMLFRKRKRAHTEGRREEMLRKGEEEEHQVFKLETTWGRREEMLWMGEEGEHQVHEQ